MPAPITTLAELGTAPDALVKHGEAVKAHKRAKKAAAEAAPVVEVAPTVEAARAELEAAHAAISAMHDRPQIPKDVWDRMLRAEKALKAAEAAQPAPGVGELDNPFNVEASAAPVEVAPPAPEPPAPPVEAAPVATKPKRAKTPKAPPVVEAPPAPVEVAPEERASAITSAIIGAALAQPVTLAPSFVATAPRTARFIALADAEDGEPRLLNPSRLQWIGLEPVTQGGKAVMWQVSYHLYLDADPELCDNITQTHASAEDARAELERAWSLVEGRGWIRGADDCGGYLINPEQVQAVGLDVFPGNPPTKKGGVGSPTQWIVSLLFAYSNDAEFTGGLHLTYTTQEERDAAYNALAALLT
jgi:hypothetical protein